MKVIAGISASLFALANGDASGRRLGQTKEMLGSIMGISDVEAKNLIRDYGCYCYTLGQTAVGPSLGFKGDPVDELDDLCKKLYRAEKCIAIDNEAGLYSVECTTNSAFQWFTDVNGDVTCEDSEEHNEERRACKKNMCELERDFTTKVAALFASGFTRNEANSKFSEEEYATRCPKTPNTGNGGADLSCCGENLGRKTYNTLVNTCCDNRVESLGSC